MPGSEVGAILTQKALFCGHLRVDLRAWITATTGAPGVGGGVKVTEGIATPLAVSTPGVALPTGQL